MRKSQQSRRAATIGIDIGGTFTDIVLFVQDGPDSSIAWTKAPTTPRHLVKGILDAVDKGLSRFGLSSADVVEFMHGTTVGTNAVLEQKGARLGILMTEGFEDVLEIGRQKRSQLYEVFLTPETPAFLCPRRRRRGVRERIAHDGRDLISLDEGQVKEHIKELISTEEIDSLAVCYLFSFRNPKNELRTREIVQAAAPNVHVSLSHEINPVFREYERLCVTAFDAYLRPVMEHYLDDLMNSLADFGFRGKVQTMQSRGGLASTDSARHRPVTTLLSGPAAGVVGARYVSERAGLSDFITLDMGGTSADVAVVKQGKPITSTSGSIGRYPLNQPMVDVQTIGSGGGSIAWLDEAGGLRVGPQSAGSEPGPACYGAGGEEPTVTDASLVLGYLDPQYFLGGERSLDINAASAALERLAGPLNMTVAELALGIHRIVNASMADAIRLVSLKRGYDLRQFGLVAFGGAGPINAVLVAEELGISRCLIPRTAGVLSALGLLVSNVEYDNARTFLTPLDTADVDDLNSILAELAAAGYMQMAGDGYKQSECAVLFSADVRFVGQSSELEIPIHLELTQQDISGMRDSFEKEHERVYGYAPLDTPIELVNLRSVHVRAPNLPLDDVLGPNKNSVEDKQRIRWPKPVSNRTCVFPSGEFVTPVFFRSELREVFQTKGPLIIEQEDTTVVIYPGYTCRLDSAGNIVVERQS